MSADPIPPHAADHRLASDLVDLTGVDFRRVARMSGSAMAQALLRIQAELDRPQDAVAGFQSAM